jgi:hypothetical protein
MPHGTKPRQRQHGSTAEDQNVGVVLPDDLGRTCHSDVAVKVCVLPQNSRPVSLIARDRQEASVTSVHQALSERSIRGVDFDDSRGRRPVVGNSHTSRICADGVNHQGHKGHEAG